MKSSPTSLPAPPSRTMPNKPRNRMDALAALTDLTDRFKLYSIGQEGESATVPSALAVDSLRLNALKLLVDYASAEFNFCAVSRYGWGMDPNPLAAITKCKSQSPRGARVKPALYRVHKDTTCGGLGEFFYPQGFPPEFIPE